MAEFASLLDDLRALVRAGAVSPSTAMAWVRYGAAQALVASPLLRSGELDELCTTAGPEAKGILSHVIAERSLA